MHEFFSREPDPIDAMLRPPSPADNEMLRQSVYMRTQRVLCRRRRLRQFAYAASLLLSFAVGAGTMRMTSPQPAPVVDSPAPSASKDQPQLPDNPLPSTDDSALEREWVAFDSIDRRGELYRQAGDRYMTEENDPQSALRCYSNALDNGTEQDLAISSNDHWLLMAIKDARQKEKKNAKQGG
ncbi:MAG TPA: hypothetical protein VMF69_08640 [Gemmataceae bacterium]|nr:hypothetical protein [Gemmataceae bacterium]